MGKNNYNNYKSKNSIIITQDQDIHMDNKVDRFALLGKPEVLLIRGGSGVRVAQDKWGHKFADGRTVKPHFNVYVKVKGTVVVNKHIFYRSNWDPRRNK